MARGWHFTHSPGAGVDAIALAGLVVSTASSQGAVLTLKTVKVSALGNPSVAIVPFTDAIYQSCADAPQSSKGCLMVGGVTYPYDIGHLEVTEYPTNAGTFGDGTATAPSTTTLNASNGNVTNASTQPLATCHASGVAAPTWCSATVQPHGNCVNVNPLGIDPTTYAKAYQGSLGTVGQAKTPSPWGTLDQGGNAVEWTDTIAPSPTGNSDGRVWRRLHGGQRGRLPTLALGGWPAATGQRTLHRDLSVAGLANRSARRPQSG